MPDSQLVPLISLYQKKFDLFNLQLIFHKIKIKTLTQNTSAMTILIMATLQKMTFHLILHHMNHNLHCQLFP